MHAKPLSLGALCGGLVLLCLPAHSAYAAESAWVKRGETGRLLYTPDAQGDRIPDFSDVGYRGGKVEIPDVPTAITVSPIAGDDTASIQAAIDTVSAMPLGSDGFRGAVELTAGQFEIGGVLQIQSSGVVLRGAGRDVGETHLQATGTVQRDLIQIFGSGSQSLTGSTRNMIDKTVPVGARSFRVNSTAGFSVGDTVRVERPSPANWISDIGMDMIPPRSDGNPITQWQPGSFNLRYDRVITRIEGDRIFVDAPLVNSFEQQYGGGTIRRYTWGSRIENVGIESLRAESDFASPTDENHAWNFVSIDSAQHIWVRDTLSKHFGRSAVLSNPGSKWVTVDNAINEEPVSLITGSRRYTFDLSGELELVTNSEANDGRHDFVNNSTRPPGPHVFHNSVANNALNDSGPHQRWATGSLFDNITVSGDEINVRNRGNFGSGHGWAGANMVIWNSTADGFIVQNPPTAQNWLVGSMGNLIDDQTFGPQPPGYVDSHGTPVDVDSLYDSQLEDASDVTAFHWDATSGNWADADRWRERLIPGAYRVESRDYLIGDIDDFVNDGSGSVDAAFIDPAWEAEILASSANPITGFDDVTDNRNVAFTIQHGLDPGERVIHGSLALSLKQAGGLVNTDFVRLFDFDDPAHRLFFSDLGWDTQINSSEAFVGLIDLGPFTDELQTGSVNVQINDDTAVDWAQYTITVAEELATTASASVTIANGGSLTVSSNVDPVDTLTLGGAASGTVYLESVATLTVVDTYAQAATGQLQIEVSDSGSGLLEIQGDALLDGSLELVMEPGYSAEAGDLFPLISVAGQVTGSFDNVVLPALGNGFVWRLLQTPTSILAFVGLQGDFNSDGIVDGADFTIWRDTLNSTTELAADANGDGVITSADYDIWAQNYGRSISGTGANTVPEPNAMLIVLGTAISAAMTRRPERLEP